MDTNWSWFSPNYLDPIVIWLFRDARYGLWVGALSPLVLGAITLIWVNRVQYPPALQKCTGRIAYWFCNMRAAPAIYDKFYGAGGNSISRANGKWLGIAGGVLTVLSLVLAGFHLYVFAHPEVLLASPGLVQRLDPNELNILASLILTFVLVGLVLFIANFVWLVILLSRGLVATEQVLVVSYGTQEEIVIVGHTDTIVVLPPQYAKATSPAYVLAVPPADLIAGSPNNVQPDLAGQFIWARTPDNQYDCQGESPLALLAYDPFRGWRMLIRSSKTVADKNIKINGSEFKMFNKPFRLVNECELDWTWNKSYFGLKFELKRWVSSKPSPYHI